MKTSFPRQIFQEIPFSRIISFALILNLLILGLVFGLQNRLPPVVPLFYGQAKGELQLAPRFWLSLPVLVASGLLIINILLAKLLKNTFLQQILIGVALVVCCLAVTIVLKTIFLVGYL